MSDTRDDYFSLFELPRQFELDLPLLTERYRQLQRAVHPDRFATASERDRLLAMQKAAQINDALAILKSPLSRAQYLLSLRGLELADEQRTYQDPEFLMEQMTLREQLAEVPQATDPDAALEAFSARIDDDIRQLERAIGAALAQGDADADRQAADDVRKLKFLLKLRQEAERLEDRLL